MATLVAVRAVHAGKRGHMPTILVIDDEPTVRDVVHDILRDEGYHVVSACHGKDGLGVLRTVAVDLILCDLMMPVMAGDAFAATLHADPRYQDIPLIIMSAAPKALPLAPGTYTAVLEKPWTILALLTTITTALGQPSQSAVRNSAAIPPHGLIPPDGPVPSA
jgi:CheY-like chemotaxis protein